MQLPDGLTTAVAAITCFIAAAFVSRIAGTNCLWGVCLEIADKAV